jgi:hypothetical protein
MPPQVILLLVTSLFAPVTGLVKLRGAAAPKESHLYGFDICPRYVANKWNASGDAAKVVTAYNEVATVNSAGHTMFAALSTNLGSLGLLHDKQGRSYAFLSAYGAAADATLVASGDEVDVVRTPAPPAAHGYLSFRGIEAAVELDKDDVFFANGTGKQIGFLMQLRLQPEAHHWRGWPRSFGYTLSGYVHLPSRGIWRLLIEADGRVVTDGALNNGGFLGGFSSFIAPLGKEKACSAGGGEGRFGPAWYQVADAKDWMQFTSSVPAAGAQPGSWKGGYCN